MHGEKKDNLLSENILADIADEQKINQKSLIDSSSCNKPEKKVNICCYIYVFIFFILLYMFHDIMLHKTFFFAWALTFLNVLLEKDSM